jgi:predicted transcriptional regulator
MSTITEIKKFWDIDKNVQISFLKNIIENETYKIILVIMRSSKTIYQIHRETNLPLSTVYKRMKKLEKMGITVIDKIDINSRGKKTILYKSRLKSVTFRLDENEIDLIVN